MRDEVCDFCGDPASRGPTPTSAASSARTTRNGTLVTNRYKGGHRGVYDLSSTLLEQDDDEGLARPALVLQSVCSPGRLKAPVLNTVKAHHGHFRAGRTRPRRRC